MQVYSLLSVVVWMTASPNLVDQLLECPRLHLHCRGFPQKQKGHPLHSEGTLVHFHAEIADAPFLIQLSKWAALRLHLPVFLKLPVAIEQQRLTIGCYLSLVSSSRNYKLGRNYKFRKHQPGHTDGCQGSEIRARYRGETGTRTTITFLVNQVKTSQRSRSWIYHFPYWKSRSLLSDVETPPPSLPYSSLPSLPFLPSLPLPSPYLFI